MLFDAGLTPANIIETLGMSPHPEGGHYVETFRDTSGGARGHSTAIYYLLPAGRISAWHRVDAAEIWHYHAGAPLELSLFEAGRRMAMRLGADLLGGERPQGIVPAGAWQSAKSLGAWTLVGCTVAPGFEFARFEIAGPGQIPDAD